MWVAFANAKATHIFSAKFVVCVEVLRPSQPNGVMSSVVSLPNHTFSVYAIFDDQNFHDMLTNNIVSFEQLGPDIFLISPWKNVLWYSLDVLHRDASYTYPQHAFIQK